MAAKPYMAALGECMEACQKGVIEWRIYIDGEKVEKTIAQSAGFDEGGN